VVEYCPHIFIAAKARANVAREQLKLD
jgi:hypothetical protein